MAKLTQHIVIDIGTSQIKIAFLELSKGNIVIKKLIQEDSTEVKRDKLDEKIKKILEASFKKQELSNAFVSLVLSYPFVEIKRLELPFMPSHEIRDAIIWQAKDRIALDIDKCFFDFVITEEIAEEYGSKRLVAMTTIAPKEIINKIANISEGLNLEIVGINVCPFLFSNILNEYKRSDKADKEETASIVEIGYGHTYISLYKQGKLVFLRVIPTASNQITNVMAGAFVNESGEKIELTKNKAEELKRKYGIPLDRSEELLEANIPTKQMLARMRPVLESLSTEIKRSFDYYTSELGGTKPKTVYLTGGGAQIKNLDVFLKDDLGLEVETLKLPEGIKNESGVDALPFLAAISVSLGDIDKKPNLLPIEFKKRRLQRIEKISIRMIAFTAFLILILSYIILFLREADYKNRLISTRSHRVVIQGVVDMYNKVSQRSELVAKISSGSLLYINIFKEISSLIPDNIMLGNFSMNEDNKILSLKGKLFYTAKTPEEILTSFMQDIEKSSLFKEANLRRIVKSGKGLARIADFEIVCEIE